MEVKKRLYTVDDVWAMQRQPGNADKKYELINGELVEMSPANLFHSWLAPEIASFIRSYARVQDLGYVFVEGGFSPPDDHTTLLAPDVAYVQKERTPLPLPQTFAGFMPDLAVEIMSPSNTIPELRRKAAIYLNNSTRAVWIVNPTERQVEVCRRTEDGAIEVEVIGIDGSLSGEDILPGFELALRELLPPHTAQR